MLNALHVQAARSTCAATVHVSFRGVRLLVEALRVAALASRARRTRFAVAGETAALARRTDWTLRPATVFVGFRAVQLAVVARIHVANLTDARVARPAV